MAPTSPGTTVVKHSIWYHAFLWVSFPFVGALLGWLLAHLPGWIEGKPLPFSGLIEILDDHSGTVMTSVLVIAGIVAGALVTLTAYDEVVTVKVSDTDVVVSVVDKAKEFKRNFVAAVFTDEKHLVLLGHDTSELVRQKTDHKSARLEAAFEAHGYPWRDADPHAAEFSRWVDGVPALDAHANAVLRARQVALDEGKTSDKVELGEEAAKVGVVVRDVKKRQYWRSAGR
ncbi:MAG: hypothetical protein ABIN55_10205 [Aeromicrobium sp.]